MHARKMIDDSAAMRSISEKMQRIAGDAQVMTIDIGRISQIGIYFLPTSVVASVVSAIAETGLSVAKCFAMFGIISVLSILLTGAVYLFFEGHLEKLAKIRIIPRRHTVQP